MSRGCSQLLCRGFSWWQLLSLWSTVSRACRLQWLKPLGSRTQAQQLWHISTPRHVGSSRIRDQTRVSTLAGGFFTMEPPAKPPILTLESAFYFKRQGHRSCIQFQSLLKFDCSYPVFLLCLLEHLFGEIASIISHHFLLYFLSFFCNFDT